MKKLPLLFVLIIAAIPFKAIAGNNDSALKTKATQWLSNTRSLHFIENKGQMMDMQRKAVNNVLFKAGAAGVDVYVTTDGLSYVFAKIEKHKKVSTSATPGNLRQAEMDDSVTGTYCRADMDLAGADIRKENIVKEDESSDRTDYYYGDVCPNGILNVHNYGKVTIKNIYPGIDWVLHTGKQGLKYDFIVHPGADPSLIRLKYKWTDKPQLQDDGSIKISTPMGNITEGTPVSYTADAGNKIQTTYNIENNEIHFNVADYNTAETLIIDPVLVWATYFGPGPGGEDIYSLQDDGADVWITCAAGSVNFPTLNPGGGAYFQGLTSSQNIVILKFNLNGVLIWSTFYGGNGDDAGYSIYSDGTNVWVTGLTYSTNFPILNPGGGAYFQATNNGGPIAIFILKFSTSGVRKWATYYGNGNNNDVSNGASISSDGKNIWVTGFTYITAIPTFNPGGGAYFQGFFLGNRSAFILEFDTAGVRKWATYYGANNATYGNSICSDGAHVWVTGYTNSTNLPMLNPGGGAYFQGALAGTENTFILEFNTARVLKWATYYGGGSSDIGNCIYSDRTHVWLTGTATSTNLPTFNPGGGAYFQGTLATPTGNAYILQFDTAGVRKWATYYGGSGNGPYGDAGYWVQSAGGNVWVSGSTHSSDFPILNSGCGFNQDLLGDPYNAKKPNPASDIFISQFSITGVPKWATYYGTDVEQDGSAIACDGNNLFVDGDADANFLGYPTLNPGGGAYYQDSADMSGYSGEFGFIGKFIIASDNLTISPTVSICRGGATTLKASGAVSYTWSPPTGLSATNIPNPVASPTITTTYTVKGVDTGACGGTFTDSVKVIVDTLNLKGMTITKDTSICSGNSITLNASGGTNYDWSNGTTSNSISITNDLTTQTYTVSISDGVCVKDTNMTVTVVPLPKTHVSGNTKICQGDSVQLTVSGGSKYLWSNGNTRNYYTGAINSGTTLTVTAYNSLGCPHDTTLTVTPDIANLSACCDATIVMGNDTTLVASGNTTKPYQWSPQVNCLNPPLCDSVKVSPAVTTTYTVTLTDSAGCRVERILTIVVEIPCSDMRVPNVFTPNYPGPNGINSVFYIKTINLDSWSIIIYDRWGKEMYNSNNPNQYWDGNTIGGSKAPDGVYYYIINATCQGTSYKKDGFVQVIR